MQDLVAPDDLTVLDANGDVLPDLVLIGDLSFPHGSDNSYAQVLTNQGAGKLQSQQLTSGSIYAGCGTYVGPMSAGRLTGRASSNVVLQTTDTGSDCYSYTYTNSLYTRDSQGDWNVSQQFAGDSAWSFAIFDVNNDNRDDFVAIAANPSTSSPQIEVYTNALGFPTSSCLPKGAGPHLCTPANNSAHSGSVNFQATGSGITGPVRLMQLYIDGKKVGNYAGNQLSTTLQLVAGTHTVTVIQVEYNGQAWKSPKTTFTVN